MTTIHDPEDRVAGRSWEFSGPLLDLNDNPLPLTGAAITWRLDSVDGTSSFIELSIGSGITVIDPEAATILVNATPSDTGSVPTGVYRDWLTVTLDDGTVLDEWSGIIRVTSAPA